MISNSDKRNLDDRLCSVANSLCVFLICQFIGVFSNSNAVSDPLSVKRGHKYNLEGQLSALSFDIENQFKLFIFAVMATIGVSMQIPWLMIPWLKSTSCQVLLSVDQFYQLSEISSFYFLVSYIFNGFVLKALWFKILFMFLNELSSYTKRMTDSSTENEYEIEQSVAGVTQN